MKHINKMIALLLITTSLMLSGCLGDNEKKEVIKIGVILPLSGNLAEPGSRMLNGIKLAKEYFKNYELFIEDSMGIPKNAVTSINKLIYKDKVKIIIGDMTSSNALAIAPIAEKNKVIMLSPGASSPKFSDAGDYIFRNWVSDSYEGELIAKYTYRNIAKSIAIIYINNDYGLGLANTFRDTFKSIGGKVELMQGYNSDVVNFKTIADKVIRYKTLYLPGEPKSNGILVKTLREQGYTGGIVANLSVQYNDFLNIAQKYSDDIIFAAPSFNLDNENPENKEFVSKYKALFKSNPDIASAHGFDAMNIVKIALEKCDGHIQNLKKCMHEIEYNGITGYTKFDTNGDVIKNFDILMIQDKATKFIAKYSL